MQPGPPLEQGQEANTKRASDQYPSLLVPVIVEPNEPNKDIEYLSGTVIDDTTPLDGDEDYGDKQHGN